MKDAKTIVLCADDFGLNAGVSQGILKLASMNRLSAVSCMVNMPDFAAYASELIALKSKVQVGLHFNLTEGNFLSAPDTPCFSLNELLIKTHLAAIRLVFIAQEFKQQLAYFIQLTGCLPDFIDGHQHIHQFPRIRKVILDLYEQQLRDYRTFIRSTYPTVNNTFRYYLKTKILALTGGRALGSALATENIPHNTGFAGIYDFSPQADYRALFRSWLHLASDNTLIMCHPGEACAGLDVIAPTRLIEFNYFLSEDFIIDCQEHNIHIADASMCYT
ncbi:MAG: ChbG/HpnK family deacetylase [Legionella sp.]|uniref:ChbG/HpnK family deacetylase n=1 Tax=Legionella sp. TaxID=459 RepID=UPI0039E3EF94